MSLTGLLIKTPMFTVIDDMEDELFARSDVLHPTEESPVRFKIIKETILRQKGGPRSKMVTIIIPTMFGIQKLER
jgi:hypothetical protein